MEGRNTCATIALYVQKYPTEIVSGLLKKIKSVKLLLDNRLTNPYPHESTYWDSTRDWLIDVKNENNQNYLGINMKQRKRCGWTDSQLFIQ